MDGRTRTELAPRAGCPVGAALRERARGGRHGADPGAAGVWASLKPRERKNAKGKRWPRTGFTLWTGNTKMKTQTGDYRKGGACLPESGDEHSAQELQCPDLSFRVKTKPPRRGQCHHRGSHRQDGGPGRRAGGAGRGGLPSRTHVGATRAGRSGLWTREDGTAELSGSIPRPWT